MIGMPMQTHGKRISIDLVQIDRAQASCTILLGDSIRCSYVASYVVVEFPTRTATFKVTFAIA